MQLTLPGPGQLLHEFVWSRGVLRCTSFGSTCRTPCGTLNFTLCPIFMYDVMWSRGNQSTFLGIGAISAPGEIGLSTMGLQKNVARVSSPVKQCLGRRLWCSGRRAALPGRSTTSSGVLMPNISRTSGMCTKKAFQTTNLPNSRCQQEQHSRTGGAHTKGIKQESAPHPRPQRCG